MKIEAIHAREIAMRLVAPFETSFGVSQDRRILLLELITDQGIGWGEVTTRPFAATRWQKQALRTPHGTRNPCIEGFR